MFELFKRKTKALSPEETFWSWFTTNKSKIEKFVDSDHSDYTVYNKLTDKIKDYNSELFPELTKTGSDQYVLIVTADGMKKGVEPTKALVNAAPAIDNWIIEKFRQPTDEIQLNFDGLEFPSSDIEIFPTIDRQREVVDIDVFIRNMKLDESKYQALAFLYLDHILGEFNSIMKVGTIDFHNLEDDKRVEDSLTLLELRNLIAEELY